MNDMGNFQNLPTVIPLEIVLVVLTVPFKYINSARIAKVGFYVESWKSQIIVSILFGLLEKFRLVMQTKWNEHDRY